MITFNLTLITITWKLSIYRNSHAATRRQPVSDGLGGFYATAST